MTAGPQSKYMWKSKRLETGTLPSPPLVKRKKMTARAYKSLFKRLRSVDGEVEGSDKLSYDCSDNNMGIVSEPMEQTADVSEESPRMVAGQLRDEGIDKASALPSQKVTGGLRCYENDIPENGTNVDRNLMENVVDETSGGGGSEDLRTSSGVRKFFDDTERLPPNCSTKNKDAPQSERSTCLRRSRDDAITDESAARKNCSLLGICVLCFKEKRTSYNSPEKELCSCDATGEDLDSSTICKDRGDPGAAVALDTAENCDDKNPLKETRSDCQRDGHENVCDICSKGGELMCCNGKDCKRCYHLCCMDPPMIDILPGIWHCPHCVTKKLELGVHSMSEGVESIWDVREVEVPNAKGNKQRQYLVKYQGLAHIHNHWVPEKQLLLENPSLVSNFLPKDKIVRWNAEWAVPHRLLRRRPILNKFHIASSVDSSKSNYEWLVKWRGLDYDHATWELDDSSFLSSSLGQILMMEYEIRCRKAKKAVDKRQMGNFVELPEHLASGLNVNDSFLLKNVNKLHEFWYKCQNAVVFDNQEQAMDVVFFIQSMTQICQPFLIIAASDSLSQWKAEFTRLAPSVDVVVYSGNRDTRKGIRASEFYEESGCVMLQVLLSSPEAVFEDLEMLRCIRWQSIVIDEYKPSEISIDPEKIKILTTDMRILLISGKMKDTASEYLNMLALLDSHDNLNKRRSLKSETNENLSKLKERLSRFIACGSTFGLSKFLEYWVPVQISNHQLEQYCATLISNSIPLCYCSRNDTVGVLQDILLAARKCCDHPYLVDSFVQERMFAEGRPAHELLDVGIKASGKLLVLDMMLTQVKTRGLRALILFQSIVSSGWASTGDILDDFLLQRFGKNTYERVDAGVSPSRKQAAMNRFNKETGQFVLLLENRACSSNIKLLSLDIIVLYNSDWNLANDLRALQKISIDLAVNQIKVFRLYSSCTLEERALVLAKQNLNLDNNLQNLSRATSDSLLMWGATHLFSKLDDYHSESSSDLEIMSGQLLLNKVTKEFQSILSDSCEIDLDPVISSVKLDVGSYSTNIPMLGEAKVQLKDGEEPHALWRNLLDRRSPQWKHLRGQCPRNRKRVQYMDGSFGKSDTQNDSAVKKHKRAVIEGVDPASVQVELQEHQVTLVAASGGGPSRIIDSHLSQSSREGVASNNNPNCVPGQISLDTEVDRCGVEERSASLNEQKSLHSSLQGEDIDKETSTHAVGRSSISSFKLNDLTLKAEENSTYEEHYEDQILLQQKLTLEGKGTSSELANMINEIKKKCDKRMKKLMQKQLVEIWEFRRIWEEERSKLVTDHKLESAIIRSLYSEGPARLEKLHLLDSSFAEKLEQHNLLKDVQLKDLEAQQLAARNEERHKAAHWLAKAKDCCSDELRAGHGTLSPCPQSEDDAGCSLSSAHILGVRDVASTRQQHAEDKNQSEGGCIQGNDVVPRNTSVSAPAEGVGRSELIGTPSDLVSTNPQNEVGEPLVVVEQLNQPKHVGTGESSCGNLLGERISDEMQSVALQLPETVNNEIVDYVNPVELSNASSKELCEGDSIGLPDAFVNLTDQTDGTTTSDLPLRGQILEPSGQTEASPNHHGLLQLHVPEDQIHKSLVSAELQDQGAQPLEKQNIFQFEVADPELVDAVTFCPSNIELQEQDASERERQNTSQIDGTTSVLVSTVTPVLFNVAAPVLEDQGTLQLEVADYEPVGSVTLVQPTVETRTIGNHELQNLVSSDASPSGNQSPAIVVESQTNVRGKNCSQNAEAAETEVLPESTSQMGGNSEIQIRPLDIGSVAGEAHETSVEPPAPSLNNADVPQQVLTALELPDQAVQLLVMDVARLSGSRYLFSHPNDQLASWNSRSLVADRLQYELEKTCNEAAQLQKNHEDMMSQLKSDCEKEIQEIIAHIRGEYEVKLQDAELEFRLKKKELDMNHNKVLMSKKLAEVFSFTCLDPLSSGVPGLPQGIPFSSAQHLHQLLQRSISPGTSACQLAPDPQMARQPNVQPMQQQTLPHSTRLFPITHQNVAVQPLQALQHVVAFSSSTTSRPPLINAISPAGNLYFSGEIRAPAPQIQAFRPATLPSIPPPQQLIFSRPPLPMPQPPPPMPQPPPPPPLITQDMDNCPRVLRNCISSPLPEITSTLGSLEPSCWVTLGDVQGNQTSSTVATNVVCLLDDE